MNPAAARPSGGNGKAVAIGIGAMLLGAVIWAVITALTKHEFTLVAIGVGALIGLSMFAARPTSAGIAVVAALLTVLGCALGDFLAIAALASHQTGHSFGDIFKIELQHPGPVFRALGGKTYLFWAIGALAAFAMTIRRIRAARMMAAPPVAAAGPSPYAQFGQGGAPYGQQQQGAPGYGQQQGNPAYGQQPYPAQGQQPYGQGQSPYGRPQQQGQGQPPYGQQQQRPPYPPQPGYGEQQNPPR